MCSSDLFLGIIALLFPPLPVWVKRGICSADSIINICLCILGVIPGLLHSWYIIAKYPDPGYDYDALPSDYEGGRVRYIVIDRHHPNGPKPAAGHPQPNYGTQGGSSHNNSRHQQQQHHNGGEGSSEGQHHGVPPSYAEVVAGDHKIQSDN